MAASVSGLLLLAQDTSARRNSGLCGSRLAAESLALDRRGLGALWLRLSDLRGFAGRIGLAYSQR